MKYVENVLFLFMMTAYLFCFILLGCLLYNSFIDKLHFLVTVTISLIPCGVGALLFSISIYDIYIRK